MSELRPLERCCVCDAPTGKAGPGDGSLYCECGEGPFCEECDAEHWCMHSLPDLTEKERAALDSVDMTPVLGTPKEQISTLTRKCLALWRENAELRKRHKRDEEYMSEIDRLEGERDYWKRKARKATERRR